MVSLSPGYAVSPPRRGCHTGRRRWPQRTEIAAAFADPLRSIRGIGPSGVGVQRSVAHSLVTKSRRHRPARAAIYAHIFSESLGPKRLAHVRGSLSEKS